MKKQQKSSFLEWNSNLLISSIKKISFNIIPILILDALFYLLSGYLIIFWLQRVQANITAFNMPADIMSLGPERAQQLVSEVRTFYYLIIFSFILLLIAIIFLASILKGIIWAKTTDTKISFKLISKFLGLNLIWMGFWFVAIFLISFLIAPSSAVFFMIAAIILGLYFTNTLYTIFMEEQKFKSILNSVKLNVAKIHLFLLPYFIALLLFYAIMRLGNFLKFRYSTILLGLVMLVYAAVLRYYVSELVSKIEGIK